MYEDSRIKLDDESLTIRTLRGQRVIAVSDITDVARFDLSRFGSRLRVVGVGFERPKTWFHWDSSRRNKSEALELEVGRFFKVGITPEDPDRLFAALDAHLAQT